MPLLTPNKDSEDDEHFPTAGLDDPVWSEQSLLDSHEYLCIHKIPRPATPPHSSIKEFQKPHIHSPNQGVPANLSPQPDQTEMPLDHEHMELNIMEDITDLIDDPEEIIRL